MLTSPTIWLHAIFYCTSLLMSIMSWWALVDNILGSMVFYTILALITSCINVFLRKASLIFSMLVILNLVVDIFLLNELLKRFLLQIITSLCSIKIANIMFNIVTSASAWVIQHDLMKFHFTLGSLLNLF